MNRRTYLAQTGIAATAGLLAGCNGSNSDGETTYGTLATSVTDQPTDIDDFEELLVTLQGIWVKPAESGATETETNTTSTEEMGSDTDDGGRRYIEFEEPQEADLVQLQGSNSQLIDETELETGEYEYLQLDVSGVAGTLTDGSEASVDTPGNAPLKFNTTFEIRAEERTTFVADFTPVQRGTGSYIIQPVASGTTVLYGDEEYTESDASATETEDGGAVMTGDGDVETPTAGN